MVSSRDAWEDRARRMGATVGGVLFKGFTEEANGVLHAWHARLVRNLLVPRIRHGGMVLDIGCGYGRLADVLATHRPDLEIVGQDISHHYCRQFLENGRPTVQADLATLPFRSGSFSGALAITSLMYADRKCILDALGGILAVLEPGAPCLFVDPGEELRLLVCRLGGRHVVSPTGGQGFKRDEYRRLAMEAGFEAVAEGGNPRDSLLLAVSAGGRLGWPLGSKLFRRDGTEGGYSMFALHRWMLVKAPAEFVYRSPLAP